MLEANWKGLQEWMELCVLNPREVHEWGGKLDRENCGENEILDGVILGPWSERVAVTHGMAVVHDVNILGELVHAVVPVMRSVMMDVLANEMVDGMTSAVVDEWKDGEQGMNFPEEEAQKHAEGGVMDGNYEMVFQGVALAKNGNVVPMGEVQGWLHC